MQPILYLNTITDIAKYLPDVVINHPLVTIVDFSKTSDKHINDDARFCCDFYTVIFKSNCVNRLRYGRQTYDFQQGSLVCIAPKQVLTIDGETDNNDNTIGWGLFFHPDLIRSSSLGAKMKEYSFFSYETNEALHLSEKEKQILYDCILKIQNELQENIDTHSQTLIINNIELLLNYCSRYYGRQFITRKSFNKDIVVAVETLIKDYFNSKDLKKAGLPTVKYLADEVHLSPNYLTDLLKKETGMNAQDHIHYHIIEEAKNILLNTNDSVGEIAYSLGFEYPQYFSKLFKQKTGSTPIEYRKLN